MDNLQERIAVLEKANQVAFYKSWPALTEKTVALLMEICQSEAGLLCQAGEPDGKDTQRQPAWCGQPRDLPDNWWAALRKKLAQPAIFKDGSVRWIDRDTMVSEPIIATAFANLKSLRNMLILPLPHSRNLPGGVILINSDAPRLDLAKEVMRRLSTEIEKTGDLEDMRQRESRLMSLNEILSQLGASLNPDQVLRMFIERARQFMQVEAVSLFLLDEKSGETVLQMASQLSNDIQVEKVRIPPGVGIIGKVIQTGETLLIEDVHQDERHYAGVDKISGFRTRSILAVPLRSRPIDLGQGRGMSQERIIGGLEAINKIGGTFKAEDIELLQILAQGASTILVVAQLYVNANTLFFDVIQALVDAIDAKDPETIGRSERISVYSAEIARELGLPEEDVYHIRLGSLFYNVGPISVSDRVLGKTGSLKKQDLQRVRAQGEGASATAPLSELAMPEGMREDQIPLYQQIVAVAEMFDKMTADVPGRPGQPADEAIDYLRETAGMRFDRDCVEAFIRAYEKGKIPLAKRGS